MKRISIFIATALLALPAISPAQDAATEERLNKLSAQIDVLIDAKEAQNKKIEDLQSQIRDLQNQVSKPTGNYASADDVKQLAEAVKEVDKKRQEDNEHILQELQNLGNSLKNTTHHEHGSTGSTPAPVPEPHAGPQKGYDYVVQQGDTLAAIVKAYREKGIKVTTQQILDANPGLKANNMKVGQKVFIPQPGQ
jgi:LysM repeat protein